MNMASSPIDQRSVSDVFVLYRLSPPLDYGIWQVFFIYYASIVLFCTNNTLDDRVCWFAVRLLSSSIITIRGAAAISTSYGEISL